jgi:hypothetical protein
MAKKIFLAALIFVCFAKCTFGMQFSNVKESDVVVKIFSDETVELNFEGFNNGTIDKISMTIMFFVKKLHAKVRSIKMSGFSLAEIEYPEIFFSQLTDLESIHISFVVSNELLKLSKSKLLRKNLKIFSVSFFEVLNSENPTNWVEICKEFQNLEIIKLCFEDPKKNMFEDKEEMFKKLFEVLPKLKSVFIARASTGKNVLEFFIENKMKK